MLGRVRWWAIAKIVLGLALGVGAAEAAFWARDGGAFAHLNFYEPDPTLGVKLRPHASMRLGLAGNPTSRIRTNGRGLRGAEWPAPPGRDEILIVGDSQVFGLGVNDDQTFSAVLARQTGRPVLNAGVPTYGPAEYTQLVETIVKEREPKVVVYVLNVANDLFELERPNTERHAVWDGWAVRKESAPSAITPFPFRRALMSESHLVYALRRLFYTPRAGDDVQFASEGTWTDLARAAKETHLPASAPTSKEHKERLVERQQVGKELRALAAEMEAHFFHEALTIAPFKETAKAFAGGDPTDILVNRFAEAARPVNKTAAQLLVAALQQDRNEAALRTLAQRTNDKTLAAMLDRRRTLRETLRALSGSLPDEEPEAAALDRTILRTKALCDRHGARLLVVALPLDVQVSPVEWAKYGSDPIDLSATRVLLEDVVRRAELAGVSGLDATDALAAAEPGAFLHGDLHMSPQGHAALARAIADTLARPPPRLDALPAGRTLVPTRAEWVAANEIEAKGAAAAHCEAKLVREWLRVQCTSDGETRASPQGVRLLKGGHGDAILHTARGFQTTLIAPLLEGDELRAWLTWQRHGRELVATWPSGGATVVTIGAEDPTHTGAGAQPQSLEAKIDAYGEYVDPRCHGDDATDCRLDSGLNAPACTANEVLFGVLRRCAHRCSETDTCKSGRCTPWNAAFACVEP
jgi:hypothetical protein